MYKSPIEIVDALQEKVTVSLENNVVRAVQAVGININKHELIAALTQDKSRYEAAYEQGKRDAAVEVVKCKDCVYWSDNLYCADFYTMEPDGYCSRGKRRKEEC